MFKENPLIFSVVVPLYNKEAEIKATVNSVLNQTFSNFELIIVNDGSTDNSLNELSQVTDERVKIINKKNEGVSIARNTGIFAANGLYIALLDGDDIWDSGYLQEIKYLIDKFENCNIFGTNYSITNIENVNCLNVPIEHLLINNYFEQALYMPFLTASSIVVKRDCFDDRMKFNKSFTHGEDLDLWARLVRKYIHIAYSNQKLVSYIHSASNRACFVLPKPDKHFAYHFNFNKDLLPMEKQYYLQQIVLISWIYLRNVKIDYFAQMLLKYKRNVLQIFYGLFKILLHNKYKIEAKLK